MSLQWGIRSRELQLNTPAHAMINLALLGRREKSRDQVAILAGAILPDVPMFVFFILEAFILKQSQSHIWRDLYFLPGWQALFDTFHSLPLEAVGFLTALKFRSRTWALFFASMGLHALGDLPLHHSDAHRHFFPFSSWRFHSPLSYWDPAYHGGLIAGLEVAAVFLSCLVLLRGSRSRVGRATAGCVAVLYSTLLLVFILHRG